MLLDVVWLQLSAREWRESAFLLWYQAKCPVTPLRKVFSVIKPIMRMPVFLSLPAAPATESDLQIGRDLLDTLAAHAHECVGMAANMIGQAKRIIVFDHDGRHRLMFNPEIVAKQQPFETQEGCLSLEGVRTTTRYKRVEVRFQDESFAWHTERFSGWTAQIIQHEIDHCNGIVI